MSILINRYVALYQTVLLNLNNIKKHENVGKAVPECHTNLDVAISTGDADSSSVNQ